MSPIKLDTLLKRRPFLPFRLHVTDGVEYTVTNPESVMVGANVVFIGQKRDVQSEYFDEPVLVALNHITRVEHDLR